MHYQDLRHLFLPQSFSCLHGSSVTSITNTDVSNLVSDSSWSQDGMLRVVPFAITVVPRVVKPSAQEDMTTASPTILIKESTREKWDKERWKPGTNYREIGQTF